MDGRDRCQRKREGLVQRAKRSGKRKRRNETAAAKEMQKHCDGGARGRRVSREERSVACWNENLGSVIQNKARNSQLISEP